MQDNIIINKITPELAEIAGMFAADGCLQEGYLCMWGNIHQDKEYYDKRVGPLFSELFKLKFNIHEKRSNGVYGFYICNRELVKFFNKKLGFPIGKKTYTVKVPKPVLNSKDPRVKASFIRGFADCDGCLSFDKRRGNHYKLFKRKYNVQPRIFLKCVSKKIIDRISDMLSSLDIQHAKNTKISYKENDTPRPKGRGIS